MKPERHPKLAHLADDQLATLVARYYEGARTADLVAEFKIDARPSDLFKLFPPRMLQIDCPHCETPLWQKLKSKSTTSAPLPQCPKCGHEHTEGTYRRCNCPGCRGRVAEMEASIEATKRQLVLRCYPPVEVWQERDAFRIASQLRLRDAVFISALYRNGNVNSDGTVGPPYAKERPLSPTDDLTKSVLDHLQARGLVRVSPTSSLDCFIFDDELTRVSAHYTFKVRYRLFPMLPVEMLADCMLAIEALADEGFWLHSDDSAEQALALWKELALHECLETFEHQGQLHKLQPPSGEKTVVTFKAMLEDLSVAQIYNIVWVAARNAAAYYQRGGVSKQQAANSMVGGCRTRADKAKVEGWAIKPYGRNFERPRSELSHVLHDAFLRIGELGFTTKACYEALPLVSQNLTGQPA